MGGVDGGRHEGLARWIGHARDKVQFQGLPARICWLEYGERAELGLALKTSIAGNVTGIAVAGRRVAVAAEDGIAVVP